MKSCSVEGCGPVSAKLRRGMCPKHYWSWYGQQKKAGTPLPPLPKKPVVLPALNERFWGSIAGGDFEVCWIWNAGRDRHGYGKCWAKGSSYLAHRYAYEVLIGDIPDGLELDHLCRVKACVNPWHLEPVTQRINTARRAVFVTTDPGPGVCIHGHPRDAANTYIAPNGDKHCRPCNRAAQQRSKSRSRARALEATS